MPRMKVCRHDPANKLNIKKIFCKTKDIVKLDKRETPLHTAKPPAKKALEAQDLKHTDVNFLNVGKFGTTKVQTQRFWFRDNSISSKTRFRLIVSGAKDVENLKDAGTKH